MAAQAQDWCDLATFTSTLKLAGVDEVDAARYVRQAVDWTARVTRLPLMDRLDVRRVQAPAPTYPVLLQGVVWPVPGMEVAQIRSWSEGLTVPPGTAPSDWKAADQASPSVGEWRPQAEPGEVLLYPPDGRWPAGAEWLEITLLVGMQPAAHPTLQAVVVNVARGLWMGKVDDDAAKLVDRLLAAYVPDAEYLPVQRRSDP